MRRTIFTILQVVWGLPQTILGFFLFLFHCRRAGRSEVFHGAFVTPWSVHGSMSLGLFIFLSGQADSAVLVHEYGHSIQSLILGPLFLPLVGLPSFLWANLPALRRLRSRRRISYYSIYPENWANALGEWAVKLPSPGRALPVSANGKES